MEGIFIKKYSIIIARINDKCLTFNTNSLMIAKIVIKIRDQIISKKEKKNE